jgi:hypothetical protein
MELMEEKNPSRFLMEKNPSISLMELNDEATETSRVPLLMLPLLALLCWGVYITIISIG